jgi:hypothetical protein
MTITKLIELLKKVEHGASGRSREITIYTVKDTGELDKAILSELDSLEISSTGDGVAGAEISLVIKKGDGLL